MTTCIIVDDELPARELIRHHVSGLNDIMLLDSFDNALDAFAFLQSNSVDLIFLDIRMPRLSGLSLIRSLTTKPKIILTTAFRDYAVEAFELDVVDYLIKPITQERFMMAVAKFMNLKNAAIKSIPTDEFNSAYIFVKAENAKVRLFLRDILYLEGLKDYIKIHTHTKVYVAYERLGYMEQKLPESKFSRIHKSFIVSLPKISRHTSESVSIDNTTLPIGRVYKNEFLKKL